MRETPDSKKSLDFRLFWPNDIEEAPRIAQLLAEMWTPIGVKLDPQALDPDALTKACCPTFDYDLIMWGWGSDPDPGFLLSVTTTDSIASGNSETGYSNPEYDKLYKQQAVELDQNKRKELIWKMQQMMFDDVVYIIPYYKQAVEAYRTDRFKGWLDSATKLALEDPSSLLVIEPVQ